MEVLSAVDLAALAILAVAVLRGLFIGMIREVFSLVALAAACVAVRFAAAPVAEWLLQNSPVEIGDLVARIAAGVVIAAAVVVVVAIVGRAVRKGARWAGLGFADRLAGGGLGAAEGTLVIVVLMLLAVAVVGRDHPALTDSQTLAAFESAGRLTQPTTPTRRPVAHPPAEP